MLTRRNLLQAGLAVALTRPLLGLAENFRDGRDGFTENFSGRSFSGTFIQSSDCQACIT